MTQKLTAAHLISRLKTWTTWNSVESLYMLYLAKDDKWFPQRPVTWKLTGTSIHEGSIGKDYLHSAKQKTRMRIEKGKRHPSINWKVERTTFETILTRIWFTFYTNKNHEVFLAHYQQHWSEINHMVHFVELPRRHSQKLHPLLGEYRHLQDNASEQQHKTPTDVLDFQVAQPMRPDTPQSRGGS